MIDFSVSEMICELQVNRKRKFNFAESNFVKKKIKIAPSIEFIKQILDTEVIKGSPTGGKLSIFQSGFLYKRHSRKDHIARTRQPKCLELQRTRGGKKRGQKLEQIECKRCQSLLGCENTFGTEKDPEFKTNSSWIDR